MKRAYPVLFVAGLFLLSAAATNAAVLTQYTFSDDGGGTSFPTTVAPGISASEATAGGGGFLEFNSQMTNHYIVLVSDGTGYLQFTVDADILMDLDQPTTLSFLGKHPVPTNNDYTEVHYSYDGDNFIHVGTIDSFSGGFSFYSFNIPDQQPLGTESLTIRLLAYKLQPSGGDEPTRTNVTAHYDDITLNGIAVPEPVSLASLGLAGLALLRRRRD